ncbi:diheme cytochrome c-553 [Mucilaginibacter gynuensis]|uniref:diheme cytochrome c-553 n=1 Tax=Mucilaginibacter gynuensis TaxID=1302236 RepID=UPI0031EFF72D
MKKYLLIFAPGLLIILFYIYSGSSVSPLRRSARKYSSDTSSAALIKRGEYLVTIIGCNDCHSPKYMGPNGPAIDSLNMLSGYPSHKKVPPFPTGTIKKGQIVLAEGGTLAMGPWGTSFAANLTSDETGIGNWSEPQFKNALRHGKFKGLDGGRMLAPLMPWQNFAVMSDEDCSAIFRYLKSTRPFKNVVPEFRPVADNDSR